MNKIFSTLLIALTGLAAVSCNENPFLGGSEEEGTLSIKKMVLKIDNQEKVVRSGVDVSNFIVDIRNAEGELVETYTYAEMPEVITLPKGDYKVDVRSGDVQPVAWEEPYFIGSQEFTINPKEITEVDTVVCKLANVKVQVVYADDLKASMGDDCKVNVVMGDGASIDFVKDETRSAYFAYVEGSNTMVATFTGTIEGDKHEIQKSYVDVAPGNFYKITYNYHTSNIPENEGEIHFKGINVDATVTVENLTFSVNPDDDYLSDDLRPVEGDRPGQGGGEDPQPPTPGAGPEIGVNAPYSFDAINDVTTFDPANGDKIAINVTSETGFTVFKVVIDSPTLTNEILSGVGLGTELDLVNPGALGSYIASLGLPINVGGSKSENVDISQFVPLLSIYGPAVHNFVVTVADSSGTTVKTLKLENK